MNYALILLVTLCSLRAMAAKADDQCQGQTPLEMSYCTLVARGVGGLPALYEFRKNSPETQYLLLKRPAAKFGVTLPPPAVKAKPAAVLPASPALSARAPNTPASTPAATPLVRSKIPNLQSTQGCQLVSETISCGGQRFALQWNKPKNALQPEALAASNQLIFPPEPKNSSVQSDYLLTCYALYVHKMLLLGLGNTTLNFSKFAAIYSAAKSEGFDFAARFERMYHFLKEERKTLQPPKGFGHRTPEHLDDCAPINDSLWSCQTAEQHWIYAKI